MLRLDWNTLFTVINILVLSGLMRLFLYKPVKRIIQQRTDLIAKNISDSEEEKRRAEELKRQYEAELQNAGNEGSIIISEAKIKSMNEYKRILDEADVKANEVIERAKKAAEINSTKILHETEGKVASLAMAVVSKIVGEQSNSTTDQALYDHFIAKAGELSDADRK